MNKIFRLTAGLLVAAGLCLSASEKANAQTNLSTFTFTGATGFEATYAPDFQPANAVVSSISKGPGVSTPASNPGANVFVALSWPWATFTAPALPNAPLEADSYFSFTVTPNAGYVLDLDSLNFSERRSSTGPRTWALRSSLDNFTSNIATMDVPDDTNTRPHKVALGAAFNNLTSAVEFRFYGYNAEADGGTWRLDDIFLWGTVFPIGPSPVVSFSASALTVSEAAGTATLTVTIANPNATNPTTVDVVVTGGTATAGDDYTYTTQTLTFPAGSNASQTVSITIIDDTNIEPNETIVLELQNATSGVTLGTGTMTVTITDNDTPPPVIPLRTIASVTTNNANGVADSLGATVRLRGITYGMNLRGHLATPGLQFTLIDNTGGIGIFRTSGLLGYTYQEGDSLEVTGTIDQFNGLTQLAVTAITLISSGNPLQAPTVVTALGENTESELVRLANPVMIVDPAQWTNSGTGFSVTVTDGTNDFTMRITSAVTSLYGQPAPTGWFYLTGLGGQFDGSSPFTSGYQLAPRYAADLTFLPSVGFATTTQSVSEGAGTATLTINLSTASTTPTTLSVAVTGGTATAGTDFTYTTQTVTFPAGSTTPQTVTVTIIDDAQFEPDETIIFSIQNISAGAVAGNATHTLTITNNDPNAVADNVKLNSLSVFPNPTASSTTIALDATAGAGQVQVFNQVGQLVTSATVAEGAASYILNMENMAAGLYTVRVVTRNLVKTGTVVKH